MPRITSVEQLRQAKRIAFCYLCGADLAPDTRSFDHVLPKSLIAPADRNPPLKLPVHYLCNQAQSVDDEVIGQLVSLLHGKVPSRRRQRFEAAEFHNPAEGTMHGVREIPLQRIVWRWISGFHAALYKEWLDPKAWGGLMTPFPVGTLVKGKLVMEEPRPDQLEMALTLKQHLALGRFDEVSCYNSRCRYVCTWLEFDTGEPFCLYGLRVYDWERLADPRFVERSCVGWYRCIPPAIATRGTSIIVPCASFRLFNPFS